MGISYNSAVVDGNGKLRSYLSSSLPDPTAYHPGTTIWLSDTQALNYTNGTQWLAFGGAGSSLATGYSNGSTGPQTLSFDTARLGLVCDIAGHVAGQAGNTDVGGTTQNLQKVAFAILDSTVPTAYGGFSTIHFGVDGKGRILGNLTNNLSQSFYFREGNDTHFVIAQSTLNEGGDFLIQSGQGAAGFRGSSVKLFGGMPGTFTIGTPGSGVNIGGGIELDSSPFTSGNAAAVANAGGPYTAYRIPNTGNQTAGDISIGQNYALDVFIGRKDAAGGTVIRGGTSPGITIDSGGTVVINDKYSTNRITTDTDSQGTLLFQGQFGIYGYLNGSGASNIKFELSHYRGFQVYQGTGPSSQTVLFSVSPTSQAIGFFGKTPAVQQVSGGTLAGVINGLVALGLFSS